MKKITVAFLFMLAMTVIAPMQASAAGMSDWRGNINWVVGNRTYSDSDLKDAGINHHVPFGINIDFAQKSWPVNLLLGFSTSNETSPTLGTTTNKMTTTEFDIGIRKYYELDYGLKPYSSIGLAVINNKIEPGTTSSKTVSHTAGFFDIGLLYHLPQGFQVGLELKAIFGSSKDKYWSTSTVDYDVNSTQGAIVIGYAF